MSDWIVAVFLGDSLTAGFQQGPGPMPPRYYPFVNMLESSLRVRLRELGITRDIAVVNQGMDGDSTRGMLERFSRSVETENPDIVLLWGGINDLSSRKTPEEVLPNIVELVERSKAVGATPVVLNVAPVAGSHFNETVLRLNNMTNEYCEETGVMYLDLFSELVDPAGKLADEYSNDGVHLSDMGYKRLLLPVFQCLLKIVNDLL
ncbi:MAG: GDSL-type esterase/lipase family protein [Candidatus Bathyarchaeota archaeon]